MQRALNLARGASIARASPRHPSYSLLRSAPSLQLFGRSYATDTSPEDSGIASSSTDSSTPRPTPPTREQLLELFKQSEENVDLEELIASLSQTPEAGESDKPLTLQDAFPLDSTIQEFKGDDSTSLGHRMLAEQRIVLDYFRKIETELPSLKAFRKPFHPPSSSKSPIVARTLSFSSLKDAPSSHKAALVVPIVHLPIAKNPTALHKFKVLAGVRWSLDPPKDAGLSKAEVEELKTSEGKEGHGYFKISHDAFPELSMNLKWCSDVLDKLVAEANDSKDTFGDIPLDSRHLQSQEKRRRTNRSTIADFPQEWLHTPKQVESLRKHLLEPKRRGGRRYVDAATAPRPVAVEQATTASTSSI